MVQRLNKYFAIVHGKDDAAECGDKGRLDNRKKVWKLTLFEAEENSKRLTQVGETRHTPTQNPGRAGP